METETNGHLTFLDIESYGSQRSPPWFFLVFVSMVFNGINQMMSSHIRSVGLSPKKITSSLQLVKDDLGLKTPGVYSIPCECGQVYIGQTDHSIETMIKEHH
jgi:hypothetical protein